MIWNLILEKKFESFAFLDILYNRFTDDRSQLENASVVIVSIMDIPR